MLPKGMGHTDGNRYQGKVEYSYWIEISPVLFDDGLIQDTVRYRHTFQTHPFSVVASMRGVLYTQVFITDRFAPYVTRSQVVAPMTHAYTGAHVGLSCGTTRSEITGLAGTSCSAQRNDMKER